MNEIKTLNGCRRPVLTSNSTLSPGPPVRYTLGPPLTTAVSENSTSSVAAAGYPAVGLPLASPGSPLCFFKVGIVSLQIGLQIGLVCGILFVVVYTFHTFCLMSFKFKNARLCYTPHHHHPPPFTLCTMLAPVQRQHHAASPSLARCCARFTVSRSLVFLLICAHIVLPDHL
jgi:hypothetical protein